MDLAFLWAIDIDFVIMWVSKLTFFVLGVEIDFVFACGLVIIWFLCVNWFQCGDRDDLFFCAGRKLVVFNVEIN